MGTPEAKRWSQKFDCRWSPMNDRSRKGTPTIRNGRADQYKRSTLSRRSPMDRQAWIFSSPNKDDRVQSSIIDQSQGQTSIRVLMCFWIFLLVIIVICKGLISTDIRLFALKTRKYFNLSPNISPIPLIFFLMTFITMARSSSSTKLSWRQAKNPSTITLNSRWNSNSSKNSSALSK